jgi:hypothetical protein
MRLLETTCAISVACLLLSLRPVLQDEPGIKPPISPAAKAAIKKTTDEMQGTWRLVSMDAPKLVKANRYQTGYMLVAGSYFSLELHVNWNHPNGTLAGRLFQTCVCRFELDPQLKMTASGVLGSTMDDIGRVLFEQPGLRRQYDVEVLLNRLKLKRSDGTIFEFERMIDSRQQRDFYGRPIEPKDEPEEGADGKTEKDGKGSKDEDGKDTPPSPPKKD